MLEKSMEDEDNIEEEAPDWRMLSKYTKSLGAQTTGSASEPFIPRRGEKDFEPTEALAPLQTKALQESRQALFTALSAGIRGHSSRDHVRCVWNNSEKSQDLRAHPVEGRMVDLPYVDGTAKGVLFSSIGRWNRERKRLELAPEELLYLIERGTVECWTAEDQANGQGSMPMSVQQAWAEIIGSNQLSLEKYQVYAYLKRLGYIVLRKEHIDSIWRSQARNTARSSSWSLRLLFRYLWSATTWPFARLDDLIRLCMPNQKSRMGKRSTNPALVNRSLISDMPAWNTFESIFNALKMIPSGSKASLPTTPKSLQNNGGYEVFYYIYKPNNRFPKASPPTPDFQVCVVDPETMPIPGIGTTCALLDTVRGSAAPLYPTASSNSAPQTHTTHSRDHRLSSFNFLASLLTSGFGSPQLKIKKPFRQNIFAKLKRGERHVLLAVVDHGITSFLKFTETDFGGTPLLGEPSSI